VSCAGPKKLAASLPPANPKWVLDVDAAIHWVATQQRELTTDDVWERLAVVSSQRTPENRAMGPRMIAAQRLGWVSSTYSTVISNRRRGAPVRVWRSNIYEVRAHREAML
jgi:hypothetical protein